MTRIVRTHYRYKRPPRKKPKAVALEVPRIVTAKTSKPGRASTRDQAKPESAAPASDDRKSAIVTARSRASALSRCPT